MGTYMEPLLMLGALCMPSLLAALIARWLRRLDALRAGKKSA